jgi:hypothetical protein
VSLKQRSDDRFCLEASLRRVFALSNPNIAPPENFLEEKNAPPSSAQRLWKSLFMHFAKYLLFANITTSTAFPFGLWVAKTVHEGVMADHDNDNYL